MYALHHPELFSSACPLSASTGALSLEDAKVRYRRGRRSRRDSQSSDEPAEKLEPLSDAQIEAYFKRHSAVELVKSLPEKPASENVVRWYIDCGDDDFLYEGNSLVHIEMRKRGIEHEYRVRQGGHTWTYWRESLPNVLHFVSQAFHQH